MKSIIISAWNSPDLRILHDLDLLSTHAVNPFRIHLCASDPLLKQTYNARYSCHSNIVFTSTEPFLYNNSLWNSRRDISSKAYESLMDFFKKECYTVLLQAHRLSFGLDALPDCCTRLEDVFLAWVQYVRTHRITYAVFTQSAHTGSDYLLKMACKYLHVEFIELYSTLDRPLYYIHDTNSEHLRSVFVDYLLSNQITELSHGRTIRCIKSFLSPLVSRYCKESSSMKPCHNPKITLKYFMHSEPECSINPGGEPFYTNIRIIKLLDSILPLDVDIIVREHPVMLANAKKLGWQLNLEEPASSNSSYRSDYFFEYIKNSDRIKYETSLDLINSLLESDGIITATGDIQHEAACLGIPVLRLGRPIMRPQNEIDSGKYSLAQFEEFLSSVLKYRCERHAHNDILHRSAAYIERLSTSVIPLSTFFYRDMTTSDCFDPYHYRLGTTFLLSTFFRILDRA